MLASVCVLAKTVLYATVEIVSGFENTKQNNLFDLAFLYILPNGLWIVIPFLVVVTLGSRIAAQLYDGKQSQQQQQQQQKKKN